MKDDVAGGTVGIFTNEEEVGVRFGSRGAGFGGNGGGGASFARGVEFAELFEEAEFALKGAFGGGFVAKHEVVFFNLVGGPVEGGEALREGHTGIEVALGANAEPFGLRGFENEIILEGVFGGLIGLAPAAEEEKPGFLRFTGEDEGLGAGAVFGGIFGRGGAAFGGGGAGAAAVAFFGFGVGVEHLISEPSVRGGRSGWRKILGQVVDCGEENFYATSVIHRTAPFGGR